MNNSCTLFTAKISTSLKLIINTVTTYYFYIYIY